MMKHKLMMALAATIIGLSGIVYGQNDLKNERGYLDIKAAIDTEKVQPQVNINIPKFLMNSILSDVKNVPEKIKAIDDRMLAILKDVKQIQLMVFIPDSSNRSDIESGIKSIQESIKGDWTEVMDLPAENTVLYACSDEAGERIGGIILITMQENEAIIGNIVGHVPIGELMILAAELEKNGLDAFLQGIGKGGED